MNTTAAFFVVIISAINQTGPVVETLPTPVPHTVGRPVPPPPNPFPYPTGHPYPDVAPEGIFGPKRANWMYPNGYPGHHCVGDSFSWMNWWYTPANMPLHYHYFPAEHGYYYFKPYNVTRVKSQQAFVTRFGGDPRHPYANEEIFARVYADLKKENPTFGEPLGMPDVLEQRDDTDEDVPDSPEPDLGPEPDLSPPVEAPAFGFSP